jgi:hypothetical protein
VAIKARLLDSFACKELKTKKVWPWLHQVEAHLETQRFELDKEQIHFSQIPLKEHMWNWWMFQK